MLEECDPLVIYGKGSDVVIAAQILQAELDKMELRTLNLPKDVGKYILENIKEIKSLIDPCEIRVKRPQLLTTLKEIRHPFYFVECGKQTEICLIGSRDEVRSGEQKLLDFCEYRTDAPPSNLHTLPFLLPTNMKADAAQLKV